MFVRFERAVDKGVKRYLTVKKACLHYPPCLRCLAAQQGRLNQTDFTIIVVLQAPEKNVPP